MSMYKKALQAINDLFADTSQSRAKTKSDLQGLRDEIDQLLDTLADADASEAEDEE